MRIIIVIVLNILIFKSVTFRKSTHSAGMGQCVEVGTQPQRLVAVRDSQDAGGPWLSVSSPGWREFIHKVKLGRVRAY
jgi:hypothetical protein